MGVMALFWTNASALELMLPNVKTSLRMEKFTERDAVAGDPTADAVTVRIDGDVMEVGRPVN
jgi:hypothetical protein